MLEVVDWGRTAYNEAFKRQKELVALRREGNAPDTLVFTEHNPVYTIGLRKGASQHLKWSPDVLADKGIEYVKTNRGGDITYHGPGQIIGYPIISLQIRKDLHAYLRDLEEVAIRTLTHFGLQTARREGKTGIWLENQRKICAIGVAVRNWVTYHGFALNVSPDLSHFSGIVPCGITDGTVTSMEAELGHAPDHTKLKERLAVEFQQVFETIILTYGES